MVGTADFLAGKTSSWGAVFNLGNSAIGAGILAFPFAFESAGLVGASVLCVVIALLELGTMNTIIRRSTAHRSLAYQSLVRSALGPAAGTLLSWTILVYLTGSCVAFMMIAGDATHAMLQRYMFPYTDLPSWAMTRWASVMLPSLIIILPLSMLRNIGALAPTSGLAVAAMTFTSAVITFKLAVAVVHGATSDGEPIMQGVSQWQLSASMLNAIPIMVFAYQCHVQAVPIYAELTGAPSLIPCAGNPPGRPSLMKKCQGMSWVAAIAFLECTLMYIITGAAGYIQFPGRVDSNILSNYDIHDDLMQAARILVGAAASLHYPIDLHPARSALYDLACKYTGHTAVYPPPYLPIASAAAFMFCLTATIACLLTDLGKVFQVIGGLAGSMVIFILPGAVMVFDPVGGDPSVLDSSVQANGDVSEADALLPEQLDGDVTTFSHEPVDKSMDRGAASTQDVNMGGGPSLSRPVRQEPDGVASGSRWTRVQMWGVFYMSIGSLIMLVTVYLTVFGTPGR